MAHDKIKLTAEQRADGTWHITGYVTVPGRESRPVQTPSGIVREIIEQGAFADAIAKSDNIRLLVDHNSDRVYATTAGGSLDLYEDAVGVFADAYITDEGLIEAIKNGRVKGWSFDMSNVQDEITPATDTEPLPIRHVTAFDITEISIIIDMIPYYSSSSIEVRADGAEAHREYRGTETETALALSNIETDDGAGTEERADTDEEENDAPEYDLSSYRDRLNSLRK